MKYITYIILTRINEAVKIEDYILGKFALLPPDEQLRIIKNLIKDWTKDELMILKSMIDNADTNLNYDRNNRDEQNTLI